MYGLEMYGLVAGLTMGDQGDQSLFNVKTLIWAIDLVHQSADNVFYFLCCSLYSGY